MATPETMHLAREVQSLQGRLSSVKKKAQEEAHVVVDAALTSGIAFAAGFVQGKYPEKAQIGQVPISLVVGGVLLGASIMGYIPKAQQDYAAAAATGTLAAYAALKGHDAGVKSAQKA